MRQRKQPVTFPSLAVSNLVSLCAIFTNLQASLVILAGLLATNNSSQRSLITIYHSRFPTLPLYSSVTKHYSLANSTSILSPVRCAHSSRQGREESNARRAFPFLASLPFTISTPHFSLSPCLPLSVSTLFRPSRITHHRLFLFPFAH